MLSLQVEVMAVEVVVRVLEPLVEQVETLTAMKKRQQQQQRREKAEFQLHWLYHLYEPFEWILGLTENGFFLRDRILIRKITFICRSSRRTLADSCAALAVATAFKYIVSRSWRREIIGLLDDDDVAFGLTVSVVSGSGSSSTNSPNSAYKLIQMEIQKNKKSIYQEFCVVTVGQFIVVQRSINIIEKFIDIFMKWLKVL